MSDLHLQLNGCRLTTAEITYRRPDFGNLLQQFIWQDLDQAPAFPRLARFLAFWEQNLDGPLYRVRVSSAQLIKPAEFRWTDHLLHLH